ncbi:hypothetical protein V6N13_113828 [Hibiscus sabdariffa]
MNLSSREKQQHPTEVCKETTALLGESEDAFGEEEMGYGRKGVVGGCWNPNSDKRGKNTIEIELDTITPEPWNSSPASICVLQMIQPLLLFTQLHLYTH